jgi:DNA-binding transcriptional regulator YhcF (GntR family)
MATLPAQLWKRTIEMFLLAGRYYKDGQLPDTNELAWSLRCPMEDLDLDLRQLAQTGIIKKTETGWLVVNFSKRQAKMTATDKMKLYRDRLKRDQYYDDDSEDVTDTVTLSNMDVLSKVTQITDNRLTDNRLDIESLPKIEANKGFALTQSLNEWHKQELIAIGRGKTELVDKYQPPPDADWKTIDDKTYHLKFDLRKVSK